MKSFLPGMNILLADYEENQSTGAGGGGTSFGEDGWEQREDGWYYYGDGPYDAKNGTPL